MPSDSACSRGRNCFSGIPVRVLPSSYFTSASARWKTCTSSWKQWLSKRARSHWSMPATRLLLNSSVRTNHENDYVSSFAPMDPKLIPTKHCLKLCQSCIASALISDFCNLWRLRQVQANGGMKHPQTPDFWVSTGTVFKFKKRVHNTQGSIIHKLTSWSYRVAHCTCSWRFDPFLQPCLLLKTSKRKTWCNPHASCCRPSRYASGTLAFGLRKISDFPWTKGCKCTNFSPMAENMGEKKKMIIIITPTWQVRKWDLSLRVSQRLAALWHLQDSHWPGTCGPPQLPPPHSDLLQHLPRHMSPCPWNLLKGTPPTSYEKEIS